MAPNHMSLGGFSFQRNGDQLILNSPESSAETRLPGFLRGAVHLLRMEFDLEGSAELDGGLVFRVQGEQVKLRLGGYSEIFPAGDVEALFRRMAAAWSPHS